MRLTGILRTTVQTRVRCATTKQMRTPLHHPISTAPRHVNSAAHQVQNLVGKYAQFHPACLSLKDFVEFGSTSANEKSSFLFLRNELLVRLANIMKEFDLLYKPLANMPSVQLVNSWYEQSFQDILEFEKADPNDQSTLTRFTEVLDQVRNRHAPVVEKMAEGVLEMPRPSLENASHVEYFLNRIYLNRIGIRMLINQHTLIFGNELTSSPRHIGAIDPKCDVLNVAEDAFANARDLCEHYYMMSPDVQFTCVNPAEQDERVVITYVPSHLYHILFELFKNSLRAVVEYHENKIELPSINVMIAKGKTDITIKIADEGGGFPLSQKAQLFKYMYSTASRPPSPQAASSAPLAGYGYGLPLSALYAQYFNGAIKLSPTEGFGCDAFVYLRALPSDSSEQQPVYNSTSHAKYESSTPVNDWSSVPII